MQIVRTKDAGYENESGPRLSREVRLSIARSLAKKLDAEDELLYFLGLSDSELLAKSKDASLKQQAKRKQFDLLWI